MPNWKTHLEVGKRLRPYLGFDDKNYNLFLMGNVLPDINNGYMFKDVVIKSDHETTHFVKVGKPSYENFYDKYKDKIKSSPMVLGYFVHLFVDYTWNNNFYTTYGDAKRDKYSKDELRKMKQNDFRIFNNRFLDNVVCLENFEEVSKATDDIEEIFLSPQDVEKTLEALKRKIAYNEQYNFYTESELEKLMEDTIDALVEKIKKL